MRTETIEIFTFAELSDKAKERAREWYRSCGDCYHWGSDNVASLNKFADWFNLRIRDYSLGGSDNRSQGVKWGFANEQDWHNLRYVRLWRYLQNQMMLPDLTGNCPFTGYCMDENLLDPLREFCKRPSDVTWQELVQDCIDSFVSAYAADVDYSYSDEAVDENIEANEYEFTEDGSRY